MRVYQFRNKCSKASRLNWTHFREQPQLMKTLNTNLPCYCFGFCLCPLFYYLMFSWFLMVYFKDPHAFFFFIYLIYSQSVLKSRINHQIDLMFEIMVDELCWNKTLSPGRMADTGMIRWPMNFPPSSNTAILNEASVGRTTWGKCVKCTYYYIRWHH